MPDNRGTFIEEAVSAGRGVVALTIGDRKAPGYFDLSRRGLVGSFIGLLGVIAFELLLGLALGNAGPGEITRVVLQTALIYAGLLAASSLLLRTLGRSDSLTPYLVALNWTNVAFTLVMLIFMFIDLGPLIYGVLIAAFVVSINIGRLVMTLKPGQIAMLLLVQVIGVSVALLVISVAFPLTPEQLAELAAASSPPS